MTNHCHLFLQQTRRGRVTRTLTVSYRRPVPLGVPLTVSAQESSRQGRAVHVTGWLNRTGSDVVLQSAQAEFRMLTEEQMANIIPNWHPGQRWPE